FMVFIASGKAGKHRYHDRRIDAGMVSAIQIPAMPFPEPEARILRLYRFASYPTAKNAKIDPASLLAYQAVADYLERKR
ncbi:MAG: hypothetical protein ABW138_20695, partial [Candidatus Thiodiazotropha sp. 4PDIVS1]